MAGSPENSPRQVRLRLRRALGAVSLVLFGISLAMVLAEASIRLIGLGKPNFYAWSRTRGWRLRPGAAGWQVDEGRAFVRVNQWGYRGPDWTQRKLPGTLRVAVLGDSFVEAQQVAEHNTASYVIQLELSRMLSRFPGMQALGLKRVEVLNFGVDGYGTAQELFTLTEDVWKFSPDVVVLAFFPGNDVRNNSAVLEGDKCRPFFVLHGSQVLLGGPFEQSEVFRFQCFMRFESRRSQLLNVLGEARSGLRAFARKAASARDASRRPWRLGIAFHSFHEVGLNDLIYRPPINDIWRDAWRVSEAEIEMVGQNVNQHHALFLLVIIGTGIQVMPDQGFQAAYLRAVGGTDLFYPSHRLVALAARIRLPVLDLAQLMSTYARRSNIYFHGFANTRMGTGHWNELGNGFAGTLIAHKIAALLAEGRCRRRAQNGSLDCFTR
jgi:hypothetical protein